MSQWQGLSYFLLLIWMNKFQAILHRNCIYFSTIQKPIKLGDNYHKIQKFYKAENSNFVAIIRDRCLNLTYEHFITLTVIVIFSAYYFFFAFFGPQWKYLYLFILTIFIFHYNYPNPCHVSPHSKILKTHSQNFVDITLQRCSSKVADFFY